MKRRFNIKRNISKFMAAALLVNTLAFNVGVLDVKAQNAGNVINLAASQVGYHEKASYAQIDDFTANSGSANYNKYARDLGIANAQPWCATFVWWCMASNGIPQSAYPQSAYVPTIKNWFAQRGLFMYRGTYTPKAGDYVIFGDCDHVGIVEHASGNYVNTIEGNTSNAVKRHSYPLDSSYILGYGIVNYSGDFTAPTISNVTVTDVTESGYTITCTVADDSGISYVAFPTWTHANGQDDLDSEWFLPSGRSYGTVNGNVATFRVETSQHNNERGMYATHIYVQDVNGNKIGPVAVDVDLNNIPAPSPAPEVDSEDILDDAVDIAGDVIADVTTEATTEEVPEVSEGTSVDEAPEVDSEATTEATTEEIPEVDEDTATDETPEYTTEEALQENPEPEPEVDVENPVDEPEVTTEATTETTEEVIQEEPEADVEANNVTINNITNNNTTNNITNNNITNNNTYNFTNEGDIYYTVQYPTDATNTSNSAGSVSNNWASDFLNELMATELANYIPEGFEVTEWEGEETAPACDQVVDENPVIMTNYQPTYQSTEELQVEETVEQAYEAAGDAQEEVGYYEADREENTDDNYYISDKKSSNDSEGFVMYTTVNGKKYKLTISIK